MSTPNYTRKSAPRELLVYGDWEEVDTSELGKEEHLRFAGLAQAIRQYIDGAPVSKCLGGGNLGVSQLLRGFRRCIAFDSSGRQFGWRALLRYQRVKKAERSKPLIPSGRNGRGGLTGALSLLFRNHPTIHEAFDQYLLSTAKREQGHEAGIRHKSAHGKFIKLCREVGLETAVQWPFNVVKQGKGAIRDYVNVFINRNYDRIVETQFGLKAKAKSNTGRGFASRLTAPRPLDVVEIDEHRCHYIGSIGFPTPGGTLWVPAARVTIIAAFERTFGAMLAYKAVFSREADVDDLLDVLAMICGMPRDQLLGPDMQPTHKAAFPCDLGGPFRRCGFNELLLDNALIHLAGPILTRARDIIGCDVNFGPVRRFERRPVCEGAFGALERHGFHRLHSTTGTDPSDPRRQDPQAAACKEKLSVARSLNLIEAVASDYNGMIGKSGFGLGRIGRIQAFIDDVDGFGMLFPELPKVADGVADLDTTLVPVTIHGSRGRGRRPYVYFEEEEYFGSKLADRWDLLKQDAFLRVRRWNISEVDLHLKSGVKVDTLKVRGRWSRATNHTRDLRKTVNRAIRNGQIRVAYDEDPVHCYMESLLKDLESTKPTSKETRNALSAVAEAQQHQPRQDAREQCSSLETPLCATENRATSSASANELLQLDDLCAIPGDRR